MLTIARIIIGLAIATLMMALPSAALAIDVTTEAGTTTTVTHSTPCPLVTSATLSLSPKAGTYLVGDDMSINIVAASPDCPINGAQGKLTYNPNALEVTSITHTDSIITSWETSTFNAELGEIVFSGTFATSSSGGLLLTIHATPRRAGMSSIVFEDGALLPDNPLSGFTSGQYRITPKELTEMAPDTANDPAVSGATPPGEVLGAATAPAVIVSSPTHPNQTAWYSASSSLFLFKFQGQVNELRLGFDGKREGRGRVLYAPIVNTKEIDDLENGLWFLHVSAATPGGGTYDTTYQIQVDRTPPENFTAREVARKDSSDPDLNIAVTATDTVSGIDHYEFSVDGGAKERWQSVSEGQFHHHIDTPGTHELTAFAYDKAGNFVTQKLSFEITYLPPPELSLVNAEPSEGERIALMIKGEPNSTVDVSISRNGDSPTIEHAVLDGTGKTEFESALTLNPGAYSIAAVAMNARGAISKDSERIAVAVSASLWGLVTRHPLIPASTLGLLFLAALGWYVWKRIRMGEYASEEDDEVYFDDVAAEPVVTRTHRMVRDIDAVYEVETTPGQIVLQPRSRRQVMPPPTRL